jgi:hypothetical protein
MKKTLITILIAFLLELPELGFFQKYAQSESVIVAQDVI